MEPVPQEGPSARNVLSIYGSDELLFVYMGRPRMACAETLEVTDLR